ncbi:alpha/beta hydrolase fold domain-containing protein [Chloroflexota bacterium]
MKILAYLLSSLSLLMSILLFIRLKGINMALFAKLAAASLSLVWALLGAAGAALGWVYQAFWAVPIGVIGAGIMFWYGWKNTRNHNGFEKAFGADWSNHITPQQSRWMVKRRWNLFVRMKTSPQPTVEKDLAFWTVQGTSREILCDLWRPADGNVSGLAFIFFHGSGWFAGDKDFGTRPFFNHLVAQGHSVMDVAYRLCPEVDLQEMVGDVKRAVTWMKENASKYGVDPEKVVLGGGSAGAHIAILSGYTPEGPDLTPDELKNVDLSVRGVVSYYGPVDLEAGYIPWMESNPNSDLPPLPIGTRIESKDTFKYAGRMDILLGGSPEEVPDMYKIAAPITHVNSETPPTLLLQGTTDVLVPVEPTELLFTKLVEEGVPAVMVTFPMTEHMFDFLLPQLSPPAQSALYDVDRFLALLNNME